jgi:hypothetical protein
MILSTTSENPYAESKNTLQTFLGIEINEMQLQRITDHYGESLQEVLDANEKLLPSPQPDDSTYAMLDGSMVLTREEKWKEAKLGRIFNGKDCLHIEGREGLITKSQYVSHFGDCKDFTIKMERVLDAYGNMGKRLIFVTDGAIWIRNWIADKYPWAIAILDFFHAKEYLLNFAKEYFKDDKQRKVWIGEQEKRLLESETKQVIDTMKEFNQLNPTDIGKTVIEYYTANITRMDYKYYLTIGKGIIGSGAIESAHRTVIQKRMKRSGQRWSKKGAKNMLCLRTLIMNGQWEKVIGMIKANAA